MYTICQKRPKKTFGGRNGSSLPQRAALFLTSSNWFILVLGVFEGEVFVVQLITDGRDVTEDEKAGGVGSYHVGKDVVFLEMEV